MKIIICSKEARIEKSIENWAVKEIAEKLGIRLSYKQYPTISDQEVEVWENIPEPWNVNSTLFKKAFLEYFKNGGD